MERVTKQVSYVTKKNTICSQSITFDVPSAYSVKSNLNTTTETVFRDNKGSAYSRFENNYIEASKEASAKKDDLHWSFCLQQAMEQNERDMDALKQQSENDNNQSCTIRKKRYVYGILHNKKKRNVRKRKRSFKLMTFRLMYLLPAQDFGLWPQ